MMSSAVGVGSGCSGSFQEEVIFQISTKTGGAR